MKYSKITTISVIIAKVLRYSIIGLLSKYSATPQVMLLQRTNVIILNISWKLSSRYKFEVKTRDGGAAATRLKWIRAIFHSCI